jgi:nitric oxide reductase large subunit
VHPEGAFWALEHSDMADVERPPLAIAFWSINIGVAFMILISILAVGLMQAWASVEYGTWSRAQRSSCKYPW